MNDIVKVPEEVLEKIVSKLMDFGFDYGPKLIGALLILIAGLIVARWVSNTIATWLSKVELEPPMRKLITRVF